MIKRPSGACKDCWEECLKQVSEARVESAWKATHQRVAAFPGPRCATHNREVKKQRKQRTAEIRDESVYGLRPGGYEALLEIQQGKCAICRRATGKARRLSVDHDHANGNVRGALCRPCNTMLGHGRDQIDFFRRAADYLDSPPALQLPDTYFVYKDQ